MRKVINAMVVAMLAGPALVLGQGGDVNKVLADMKAALGGADKVAAVKTIAATGRSLRTNASGTTTENEFELAMELPDKYMMRSMLMNMGSMSIYRNAGFNGAGLIDVVDQPPSLGGGGGMIMVRRAGGPADGSAPSPEQQAEMDARAVLSQKQEFARLALGMFGSSYDAFPLEFSYGGEAEAADGKAWVIDAKGADDFSVRLFVDARTNLPLMMSWMAPEPPVMQQTVNRGGGPGAAGGHTMQMGQGASFASAGSDQMTAEERERMMADMEARRREAEANRKIVEYRIYYSNYRTVGGVKLPHTMQRSIDGKPTEEMTFDSLKVNPKIDSKKFDVTKR
jgi:hypothetical protein